MGRVTRREFAIAAAGTLTLAALPRPLRAETAKLKVGVLLPRSGIRRDRPVVPEGRRPRSRLIQGLGVDIELMNADIESNVDTARTRARG